MNPRPEIGGCGSITININARSTSAGRAKIIKSIHQSHQVRDLGPFSVSPDASRIAFTHERQPD